MKDSNWRGGREGNAKGEDYESGHGEREGGERMNEGKREKEGKEWKD